MAALQQQDNVQHTLAELATLVDGALASFCDKYLSGPAKLVRAMRYSMEAGGKRLRPTFVLLASDLLGGRRDQAMFPAVAIEMIHTFSLIHDDLPAMDNDDFRRGRPTCHKAFDEATAILAGDGLLAFAFELIARHYPGPPDRAAALAAELAQATGPAGMTGGQALDMDFDPKTGREGIEKVHALKTAALIRCACRLGAISAGAGAGDLDVLGEYGLAIGLAFQVTDDYLDQTATASELGKKTGKDAQANKPNWAVHLGLDSARAEAQALADRACRALDRFGPAARNLVDVTRLVVNRKS